MDQFLPMTPLPPDDNHRFLYTYWGRRFMALGKGLTTHPLYVYDGVRGRPLIILGAKGPGKTDFLINLAIKDATCERPIVFIDGSGENHILDELNFWCGVQHKAPVLALMPYQDQLSHTWNPLITARLKPGTIADSLFNAYSRSQKKGVSFQKEMQFQRDCLGLMIRALAGSGKAFNFQDVLNVLSQEKLFKHLQNNLKREGLDYYRDIKNLRSADTSFTRKLSSLTQFLKSFDSWTLNSYNPSIKLETLWSTHPVLYVGLPREGTNETVCSSIGNILINQLKFLNAAIEANDRQKRKSILVILNNAQRFLDKDFADWLAQIRLSNLMFACSFDTLGDLNSVNEKFAENIISNNANIVMFKTHDDMTAEWFVQRLFKDSSENRNQSAHELKSEDLQHMPDYHYILRTPTFYTKALLVEGPHIPDVPGRESFRYKRDHYNLNERPTVQGLWSKRWAALPDIVDKEDVKPKNNPKENLTPPASKKMF